VAQPGSVGNRSQLWHAAIILWRAHPIFGIGAGNFEFELARAGYPGLRTHANSLYLQSLAEGGVISFTATLALVVVSIASFVRAPREPLIVAALAASIGFAIHQFFDLLVFFPKVGELWWILLALAAARADAARHTRTPS
jgi:O-antigen ligase